MIGHLTRKNPLINAAVERLFKIMEPMQRGDILLMTVLDEVIGGERHEHPWGAVLMKLKRKMEEERGITLVNEMMVGYVLAPKDVQLAQGVSRTRKAKRHIVRGVKSVSVLPDDDLTLHEKQRKTGTLDVLSGIERTMREQQRLQQFLLRPREHTPRIAESDANDAAVA